MIRHGEETSAKRRLLQSCEILFGSDPTFSVNFLNYLQISGLKTAYRKRVMETHPDRVLLQDRAAKNRRNRSFQNVQDAYETLLCFLKARDRERFELRNYSFAGRSTPTHMSGVEPLRKKRKCGTVRSDTTIQKIRPFVIPAGTCGSTPFNTERFYQGAMPRRSLLFGHFLYYSGLTNWRTISRVLVWQRLERPRLGELGHQFKMLCDDDIALILARKEPFRPFGMTAMEMGLLNEDQLQILIFHQQRLQKKFGRILVEKKLIEKQELQTLLAKFRKHNVAFIKRTKNQ